MGTNRHECLFGFEYVDSVPKIINKRSRSIARVCDFEGQFSADVASLDHLMSADRVLQRKHMNRRYVHRPTINQIGDLPHRFLSALKIDHENDLVEASSLSFLPIALNITVCCRCETLTSRPAGRSMSKA